MSQMRFDPDRALGAAPEQPARGRRPLTVSEAAALIQTTLETHTPGTLRVVGEISNLKRPNHWYFSLKDDNAVLGCVAWASSARTFGFEPEEGMEVVASGYLGYYGPAGRTQLYVRELVAVGGGALEARFRALCEELRGLGYFDDAHKVALPLLPRRIAVITSAQGAALHDVIDTARARCPAVGLLVVDVRVQGDGAAAQVASAIRRVDRDRERLGVDAILVTRGGGSVEDLWAFNERVVADAAYECTLPLVAAIGHESDTTVIELVADRRAATPTQAVIHLMPAAGQLAEQVGHLEHRLSVQLRRVLDRAAERLDRAGHRLDQSVGIRLARERERLLEAAGALAELRALGPPQRERLAAREARLRAAVRTHLERCRARAEALGRTLASVDPRRVLQRGYSMTMRGDGTLVRSIEDVEPGVELTTRVADGSIRSVVTPKRGSADQMDLFGENK